VPLKVHFLNVGHGDCTFVELPSGRLMMVDINNSKSLPELDIDALAAARGIDRYTFRFSKSSTGRSWEDYYKSLLVDPYDYYMNNFASRSVFRYIQTHPDMDHMGGLHRFFWQEKVSLENFWDVDHGKEMDEDDFESSPYSYADWLVYRALRLGIGPDGDSHTVIKKYQKDTGQYWTEDDIEVLGPTRELVEYCDKQESWNNSSYVLRLSYGGRSLILPGDAEQPEWDSIEAHAPECLPCDVLKAAHHGRESGYSESATEEMSPSIVICSVGKKPSTDASDEYESHGAKVLSTRYYGTITVTMWHDGEVWVNDHVGARIASLPMFK
jgi:competence protein ComEC